MRYFKRIIAVILCLLMVAGLCACKKENETPKEELKDNVPVITEEVKVEQVTDFEAKESPKSQLDVTDDDWLKIISIGELDEDSNMWGVSDDEKSVYLIEDVETEAFLFIFFIIL